MKCKARTPSALFSYSGCDPNRFIAKLDNSVVCHMDAIHLPNALNTIFAIENSKYTRKYAHAKVTIAMMCVYILYIARPIYPYHYMVE